MSESDEPRPRATRDDRITRVVTKPWFRAIAPKVLPRIHRGLRRLTRGRFVPGAALVLTTTGAKSGKRRETPLEAIPDGADLLIVGSNFAQDHHPAWSANLIANPEAEILVRGRISTVTATLLGGAEREAGWHKALEHFAGWEAYRDITDRDFRIFRLTPQQ